MNDHAAQEWLRQNGFDQGNLHAQRTVDGWATRTPFAHAAAEGNLAMCSKVPHTYSPLNEIDSS